MLCASVFKPVNPANCREGVPRPLVYSLRNHLIAHMTADIPCRALKLSNSSTCVGRRQSVVESIF